MISENNRENAMLLLCKQLTLLHYTKRKSNKKNGNKLLIQKCIIFKSDNFYSFNIFVQFRFLQSNVFYSVSMIVRTPSFVENKTGLKLE